MTGGFSRALLEATIVRKPVEGSERVLAVMPAPRQQKTLLVAPETHTGHLLCTKVPRRGCNLPEHDQIEKGSDVDKASEVREIWRPAPGFEGSYEVSDFGRVRSLDRWVHPRGGARPYFVKGRMLTPRAAPPEGYVIVTMCAGGITFTRRVHRLVAEAFVAGRADGLEVCHTNGDVTDNQASNLRWDSHSANILDVVRHGNHANATKTHCKHGHEFNATNTRIDKQGRRDCRPCAARRDRERRARRKAAVRNGPSREP